jgi:MFS family permease
MFWMMMYASVVNFAFGAVMAGGLAYVLLRTGSQTAVGITSSVQSLAALLGAVVMSMWGGTRPRIHTIMPAITVMAIGLTLLGISHHPILIGVAMFVMMFPNPFANASAMSLMQTKVPADMQGRVFSVVMQVAMLLQPLGLLLVGPLMDQVVEPAVGKPGWEVFAPLVGNTPGSGIGLVMIVAGVAIVVTSLLMYAWPFIRNMEATMPDYTTAPQTESDKLAVQPETAPAVPV